MEDYGKAEPFYRRALGIFEKTLGPQHPHTATSLNNLAELYNEMGDYLKAEPLYQRALAIRERTLGPQHLDTAVSLNNLAALYRDMGDYAKAEPLYQRALAIFEKTLGPQHPNNAVTLSNLATLLVAKGQQTRATTNFEKAWHIRKRQCAQVLSFASEQEQSAFAGTLRNEIRMVLSFAVDQLPRDATACRLAFDLALTCKSAMLEAQTRRLGAALASPDPHVQQLMCDWQQAGRALAQAMMAVPKPGQLQTHLARLTQLEEQKEAAEKALARASARFASEQQTSAVSPTVVARSLPPDSALVEFVKYQSFDFTAKGKKPTWGDYNYTALVLRRGQNKAKPEIALVRLGPADRVEAAVKKWHKAAAPDEQGRRSDKAIVEATSQELADLVWNPIVPALAGCRKVYVSPYGQLSFVSFAALPGSKPDSFVIDDYDITYVATGRDLVRTGSSEASAPLLVGAPDFGDQKAVAANGANNAKAEDQELLAMRPGISGLRSFSALTFAPLPGTRTEVEQISRLLQEGKDTLRRSETAATVLVVLTGLKADEATVRAAKHPVILHLATHGFFLPDSGLDEVMRGTDLFRSQLGGDTGNAAAAKLWRQMKLRNPMHRSGIALAGANDTIRGRREAGGNDGILTAEEVAGMDLWGTQMVVISACESGLGEARGGEGVFGLRRAFTIAGAQSLVMSLWAVSDDATRQLMESLYRHLPEQHTPQRALLAAQREWIAKKRAAGHYPHPVHWASFVASGIGLGLENK